MIAVFMFFLFVFCTYGASQGEICVQDGVHAVVCTRISQCHSILEDIMKNRFPKICGGTPSGEPLVCCVLRDVITTTDKPARSTTERFWEPTSSTPPSPSPAPAAAASDRCQPIPPALTAQRNGRGRKAWDKCLEYQELVWPCRRSMALLGDFSRSYRCFHDADDLIVGGSDASEHEFPHMALLGFGDDSSTMEWSCGGALVSDRFVLTAGHCIVNTRNEPVTHVALGMLRRSDAAVAGRGWHRVKRAVQHPRYSPPQRYHDIALLELQRPVLLNEYTVPACLYTGQAADLSRASATGWGLTHYNTMRSADVLQKVVLTRFGTLECAVKFSSYRLLEDGYDERSQICYGDRTESKDTCEGDSGGPLQVKNNKIACMYSVVGVTSSGRACGTAGLPAIYTRVYHYLDWIEGVVWP